MATMPQGWALPEFKELEEGVMSAISECKDQMVVKSVAFEDELKKAKTTDEADVDSDDATDDGGE